MEPADQPSLPSATPALENRRVGERRPSDAPLRVRLEGASFEAVCDNISDAGVFFTSGQRLRVTVELEQPGGGRRVLSGHLVRVQRMSSESTGYAIELDRG